MVAQEPEPTRAMVFTAIGFVLLSLLCFDLMSIMVRFLLERYSPQELSAYRNVLGVLPSLVVLLLAGEFKRGRSLKIRQWKLALLRGVFVAAAQLFYFFALGQMDYATVVTLMFTGALFVVAMSVPVLGERVGAWRWGAVLVGFLGVVLILRPGTDTFTLAALLPICAALCYASSTLTVRKFDKGVPSALIYLYSATASAISATVLALFTTQFTPVVSLVDAGLILVMGIAGGCGVLCLMLGNRYVPPSIVAPFQYFGLLSALAIGFFLFDELPVETLFPGVLFIVGAGLLVLWRQARKSRA